MDVKRLDELEVAGLSISKLATCLCEYDVIEMPTAYLPDMKKYYAVHSHGVGGGYTAISLAEGKLLLYIIERAGDEDG